MAPPPASRGSPGPPRAPRRTGRGPMLDQRGEEPLALADVHHVVPIPVQNQKGRDLVRDIGHRVGGAARGLTLGALDRRVSAPPTRASRARHGCRPCGPGRSGRTGPPPRGSRPRPPKGPPCRCTPISAARCPPAESLGHGDAPWVIPEAVGMRHQEGQGGLAIGDLRRGRPPAG